MSKEVVHPKTSVNIKGSRTLFLPTQGHHDFHHSIAYHDERSEPMRYKLSSS